MRKATHFALACPARSTAVTTDRAFDEIRVEIKAGLPQPLQGCGTASTDR